MVCSYLYAGFRPWRLKSLRSMELLRQNKFTQFEPMRNKTRICQIYIAFPDVLFLALSFSLLPRFSSLEHFSSILTVVFSRTFHHLKACLQWQGCFPALFVIWTLLFNKSGVFQRFSSFERFSSITVVFSRAFHHLNASLLYQLRLQIFPLFVSFTLSLCFGTSKTPLPLPPFVSRCAFPFFSSFAHTSRSLSFSCAFCHSRLFPIRKVS